MTQLYTQKELDHLRAVAEAATQEGWKASILYQDGCFPVGPYSRDERTAQANAAFIEAADPPTVLRLLDEINLMRDALGQAAVAFVDAHNELTAEGYHPGNRTLETLNDGLSSVLAATEGANHD